ncbi:uncharacterized protein [Haliotis asinina]|uniref:uncharacterized protein n=1 Tax=Haliotis asinina TaxID=109174 RepID=UPI003531B53D
MLYKCEAVFTTHNSTLTEETLSQGGDVIPHELRIRECTTSTKYKAANSSMSDRPDQKAADNRSNQCNPNNEKYQGHEKEYTGTGDKADLDNHGNQLNPNNPEYGGGVAGGKK